MLKTKTFKKKHAEMCRMRREKYKQQQQQEKNVRSNQKYEESVKENTQEQHGTGNEKKIQIIYQLFFFWYFKLN